MLLEVSVFPLIHESRAKGMWERKKEQLNREKTWLWKEAAANLKLYLNKHSRCLWRILFSQKSRGLNFHSSHWLAWYEVHALFKQFTPLKSSWMFPSWKCEFGPKEKKWWRSKTLQHQTELKANVLRNMCFNTTVKTMSIHTSQSTNTLREYPPFVMLHRRYRGLQEWVL